MTAVAEHFRDRHPILRVAGDESDRATHGGARDIPSEGRPGGNRMAKGPEPAPNATPVLTDELIAGRRETGAPMPDDMPRWMAGTIIGIDTLNLWAGRVFAWLTLPLIFTIPALFMWGMAPPYLQVVVLCFLGAVLGLAAMIPLRRLLIVQSHEELPYPEGTACAEVLRATTGEASGSVWIFRGMAVGAQHVCRVDHRTAFLFRHRDDLRGGAAVVTA